MLLILARIQLFIAYCISNYIKMYSFLWRPFLCTAHGTKPSRKQLIFGKKEVLTVLIRYLRTILDYTSLWISMHFIWNKCLFMEITRNNSELIQKYFRTNSAIIQKLNAWENTLFLAWCDSNFRLRRACNPCNPLIKNHFEACKYFWIGASNIFYCVFHLLIISNYSEAKLQTRGK